MDQSTRGMVPGARECRAWGRAPGSEPPRWRVRGHVLGIALVGTLVGAGRGVAQDGAIPDARRGPPAAWRLTARPCEMATGTQTGSAGGYYIDSNRDSIKDSPIDRSTPGPNVDAVFVPSQCRGTRRCPLVVFARPEGPESATYDSVHAFVWHAQPLAERYGMIFLLPHWQGASQQNPTADSNKVWLDAALRFVLRNFAIDPAKIALVGRDSYWAAALGLNNPDVFSRIAVIGSGLAVPDTQPRPQLQQLPEYLLMPALSAPNFDVAQRLRTGGHRVQQVFTFRGPAPQVESYALLGRWLHESWTYPDPATRPKLPVMTTLPRLTPQALTQLTTFWTRFLQEPDSIRRVARRAHLREIVVPIGPERPSVWLTDMAALAAKYPSVAAALKAAGLSAQQHDAYRLALLSAAGFFAQPVPAGASAVLVHNVEFLQGYGRVMAPQDSVDDADLYEPPRPGARNELEALEATKMFRLP